MQKVTCEKALKKVRESAMWPSEKGPSQQKELPVQRP